MVAKGHNGGNGCNADYNKGNAHLLDVKGAKL